VVKLLYNCSIIYEIKDIPDTGIRIVHANTKNIKLVAAVATVLSGGTSVPNIVPEPKYVKNIDKMNDIIKTVMINKPNVELPDVNLLIMPPISTMNC
jgi:hypothetical protein